ncbi:hypothetical protein ACIQM0_06900 [Streptomyces sp. NPDC091387]|uniref:hypothetical protein n=1 Tax=Streptomyces sp. NPDC091387 TaxID=3365998 RepID=UPI0038243A1F
MASGINLEDGSVRLIPEGDDKLQGSRPREVLSRLPSFLTSAADTNEHEPHRPTANDVGSTARERRRFADVVRVQPSHWQG